MQTHANEAMHDGGSRGWSPWCTCIVVTTCCSGFASIQLSMSGDGKRLNPRTSNSILFLHGCHNLYFRRNHVADVFCSFRRNHIADCILIFSSISCRQCILMTFLDMETMQENFYYLKMHRWFLCFLSNLHVSGFSSCRITQMIHSCLVCVVHPNFINQHHHQTSSPNIQTWSEAYDVTTDQWRAAPSLNVARAGARPWSECAVFPCGLMIEGIVGDYTYQYIGDCTDYTDIYF